MIQFNISYPKFNSTIIQFKKNSGDSNQKIIQFITQPKKRKKKRAFFYQKLEVLIQLTFHSLISWRKKIIQDYSKSFFLGRGLFIKKWRYQYHDEIQFKINQYQVFQEYSIQKLVQKLSLAVLNSTKFSFNEKSQVSLTLSPKFTAILKTT